MIDLIAAAAIYSGRVEQLEKKVNEVVSSQCFFDQITKATMVQTNGRNPLEVALHLRSLNGQVKVHYYRKNNNVVGYRQPPSKDVHFNLKFHDNRSVCTNAGNAAHEALGHSLGGYSHDFKATKRRPLSVPYTLNTVFKRCCL